MILNGFLFKIQNCFLLTKCQLAQVLTSLSCHTMSDSAPFLVTARFPETAKEKCL